MYYTINMLKAPYNLKCEYLSNPIGIDTKSPRFSWMKDHEKERAAARYQCRKRLDGSCDVGSR